MKAPLIFSLIAGLAGVLSNAPAADPVYSGPQTGERTTPFKVLELTGPGEGAERDPISENAAQPTALVFLHAIERSLVPLLRVIDEYSGLRKDRLRTEMVFLVSDRLEGEQRVKAATRSLQLKSRVGISLDGIEGPGNYGLNKNCMMTILIAKDSRVTANFALTQPGIADAPKVVEALARVCGDASPPTVAQLSERPMARGARMRPAAPEMAPRGAGRVDFSRFDLNSEAGLRDAVRALMTEVRSLRAELAELKGGATASRENNAVQPKEDFPGAVPTDPTLNSLLRRFIRPTNDDATVDALLKEMESHIRGNADLTQQAIDGWTRVLHFGDRYGTAYARKAGRESLDRLKAGKGN